MEISEFSFKKNSSSNFVQDEISAAKFYYF